MRLRGFLMAIAVVGLTIPAAEAQRGRDQGDDGPGLPSGAQGWNPGGARETSVRPLRDVLRSVELQLPGQLVGAARLQQMGPRSVYTLRWRTTDGRLLDIAVDAQSGAIVR
jgi:uncharacterized membrane protein YkoI